MLAKRQILEMLKNTPPLIEGLTDAKKQVQPSGVDFTLQKVFKFKNQGSIDFDNSERVIPETEELNAKDGWYVLNQGVYKVRFNEVVHMPIDLLAIARPRSTLLRCGATMNTALWDPGYSGRSESMMTVMNPNGIRLKQNARVMQIVFMPLKEATEAYSGQYNKENI